MGIKNKCYEIFITQFLQSKIFESLVHFKSFLKHFQSWWKTLCNIKYLNYWKFLLNVGAGDISNFVNDIITILHKFEELLEDVPLFGPQNLHVTK